MSDEKHTWVNGEKVYCATTIAEGCVLGASIAASAGQEDLENAYGVFKQEVQTLKPHCRPETCNTDGWLPSGHSGIKLVTPEQLHYRIAQDVVAHPSCGLGLTDPGRVGLPFFEI